MLRFACDLQMSARSPLGFQCKIVVKQLILISPSITRMIASLWLTPTPADRSLYGAQKA